MPQDKPPHPWFQFSLRTMLIFVTIASASFSWLGVKLRQAQRQSAAIAAIVAQGGVFHYDYEVDSDGHYIHSPAGPRMGWLRKWTGSDLFANAGLVDLGIETTDAALRHVESLHQLRRLYIHGARVTDAGMVNLKGLEQLKSLTLSHVMVTDSGLVHLQGLTQLKTLTIEEAPITDVGLTHLQGLTQLQGLVLSNTQVTDTGVQELQKALPKLMILR
jgi:hypothetical protein